MVLVVDKTLTYVRSQLTINSIPRSIKLFRTRVIVAHDGGLSVYNMKSLGKSKIINHEKFIASLEPINLFEPMLDEEYILCVNNSA